MLDILLAAGGKLRTRLFTAALARSFHKMEPGARICPPFRFYNLGAMSLGKRVMVNRDCWFNALPQDTAAKSPLIVIHEHASIGQGSTISAASRVEIGAHVLMARNVYISDHGHAFEDPEIAIINQGITRPLPVTIGERTWLGQNVCVLPGVTIGRHCVVGANSVVRSNLPDYSVAVGSPARVVKRFDPERQCWIKVP